uniref:Uncharacterized protein n=1 Tax=Opuntia streptacantha TaxID=393608 RepID=A0A7C9F5C4_OPUST
MHNPHVMAILDNKHQFLHYTCSSLLRKPPFFRQLINQPSTRAQLHNKMKVLRIFIHSIQHHNPRVPRQMLHYLHFPMHCLPLAQSLTSKLPPTSLASTQPNRSKFALPNCLDLDIIILKLVLPITNLSGSIDTPNLPL